MVLAMVIDGVVGWPDALYARIGHPVTWLGRLIGTLDQRWNRDGDAFDSRRLAGVAAALAVIVLASAPAFALQTAIGPGWRRILLAGILAWPGRYSRHLGRPLPIATEGRADGGTDYYMEPAVAALFAKARNQPARRRGSRHRRRGENES